MPSTQQNRYNYNIVDPIFFDQKASCKLVNSLIFSVVATPIMTHDVYITKHHARMCTHMNWEQHL